jgi:beta-lactamase class A
MRGGPVQALLRLVIYVLLACLLTLVGTAAYASQGATALPSAAVSRQQGQLAHPVPSASPAPPVTTVPATSAFDQLRSELAAIAERSGARVGISLQELSGPRRNTLSLNGNQSFYAASAYKVPLLMAEAQQIAFGEAKGSDLLCFDPDDAEDGWFDDYDPGSCFTRDQLALRTGRYSDNTAAHILVRYLGGADALNGYAKSIGMTASALWVPNTTTTDDLTAAWVDEALGRLGGGAAQAWLFPLLTHTVNEHGIPAGLPASATVVHKIGTMNGTENDSASIVSGRTSYVLSVAVDGIDESVGWSLIAQISGRIWQYESSRPDFVAPVVATTAAPSTLRPNHH